MQLARILSFSAHSPVKGHRAPGETRCGGMLGDYSAPRVPCLGNLNYLPTYPAGWLDAVCLVSIPSASRPRPQDMFAYP